MVLLISCDPDGSSPYQLSSELSLQLPLQLRASYIKYRIEMRVHAKSLGKVTSPSGKDSSSMVSINFMTGNSLMHIHTTLNLPDDSVVI